MNNYTVYIHTNRITGMKYVGITCQDVAVRWQTNGNGYRKQEHFWRAIKKYGWNNFDHEIIASELSKEDACKLEQELIAKYDTRNNTKGYNKSIGGEAGALGVERTEEQRAMASRVLLEKWKDPVFREEARKRTIAMNQSEDIRKKRSESNRRRGITDETRERISRSKTGHKLGPFSEEHKRKIREHHAGGDEPSAVVCVDTGECFKSINDAAMAKGINKKGISGCCRKVPHYNTAGGFHWRFASEV